MKGLSSIGLISGSTFLLNLIYFQEALPGLAADSSAQFTIAQIPLNDENRDRLLQPQAPISPEGIVDPDSDDDTLQTPSDSEPTPDEADENVSGSGTSDGETDCPTTNTQDLNIEDSSDQPTLDENIAITIQSIDLGGEITVAKIAREAEKILEEARQQIGERLTIRQLREQVSDPITALYLEEGYLTSFAALRRESLTEAGQIQVEIVEGVLAEEDIEICGKNRLNEGYIRSRILRGATAPLNINRLEEHLRLLRSDPLIENVEPVLRGSGEVGRSLLTVTVTEARAVGVEAFTDNYSPPSIGGERFGVEVFHRNLSGFGDTLSAAYDRSVPGSSETVEVFYRVPVNALNGTIELRGNFHDNEIIQEPFDQLELKGDSTRYEISYRQPIIRTLRRELALSFGFTYRDAQTFVLGTPSPFSIGPEADGTSRTSVFKFGQDFIRRDPRGIWVLQSQLNIGTGLLDATTNNNSAPDGEFMSWLLQAQRVQRINPRNFLIFEADLQLTPNSLLPSEQFVIGGGRSLRGYRQNSHVGDSGFRVSIEHQLILKRNNRNNPFLIVAPFIDMGSVWNSGDNPNPQEDELFIMGAGAGVELRPLQGLSFRVDYGLPIINTDEGENIQDAGLYFKARYGFPQ